MSFRREFLDDVAIKSQVILFHKNHVVKNVSQLGINYKCCSDIFDVVKTIKENKYTRIVLLINGFSINAIELFNDLIIDDLRVFLFSVTPNAGLSLSYEHLFFLKCNRRLGRLYLIGVLIQVVNPNKSLEINFSSTHGFGLFAKKNIEENSLIIKLFGKKIKMKKGGVDKFVGEWNALRKDMLLIRKKRTIYGFINHSRIANCTVNTKKLEVLSKRKILAGEELFLDYRKEPLPDDYLSGHGAKYL